MGYVTLPRRQGEASIDRSTQPFVVELVDIILVYTILIYVAAIAMIAVFAKFTLKLIKQHNDIYPLLYDLEEMEKKNKRGEG